VFLVAGTPAALAPQQQRQRRLRETHDLHRSLLHRLQVC
jgi:hypothetical protein